MDYLTDAIQIVTELLIAVNANKMPSDQGPLNLTKNGQDYLDMRLEQALDSLQQLQK